MTVKNLYKYERSGGGITVSPEMPEEASYTLMYRLIADKGMVLANGDIRACCIDTDSQDGWLEEPEEEEKEKFGN